jgi:hypothetical protein
MKVVEAMTSRPLAQNDIAHPSAACADRVKQGTLKASTEAKIR